MIDLSALGLDFPFMKELVATTAGVSGFAYTCYRYGRRVGSSGDQAQLQQLRAENEQFKSRFSELGSRHQRPQGLLASDAEPPVSRTAPDRIEFEHSCSVRGQFQGRRWQDYHLRQSGRVLRPARQARSLDRLRLSGFPIGHRADHARVEHFKTNAHHLLEGGHEAVTLRGAAERLSSIDSNLWIYPAFYGFSRAEIQMMFRWLVGQDEEIRYNLSRYLQSAPFKSDADSAFDIVLIDAPPRLLTGVVNALAASTDVLIPTILDGQSHIATLNTITAVQQFRQKLNPGLRVLGVVPSMVSSANGL